MPTTQPRYPVTDAGEVAAVLDEAARRWPDVPRRRLIQRILLDWRDGGQSSAARRDARRRLAGSLPGSSALYDRHGEWPA